VDLKVHPHNPLDDSYIFLDVLNLILDVLGTDFGWEKVAYAYLVYPPLPNISYLTRFALEDIEGFLVLVCLPSIDIKIFEQK
jgi:hypothetical protein